MVSPEKAMAGAGGELVVTTSPSADPDQSFGLWFCVRGGAAGSAVWQLIAGVRPYPGTLFKEGANGTHVKHIQMQLNLVSAAGLIVDGEFGPLTRQAVVDFQNAQRIAADGTVGPITWKRLFTITVI